MTGIALITAARRAFHQALVDSGTLSFTYVKKVNSLVASNADGSQRFSRETALAIAQALGATETDAKLDGQRAGKNFEQAVQQFLTMTFPHLGRVRPGTWKVENVGGSRGEYHLGRYEPYRHLVALAEAVERDPTLVTALGNSYDISPDVLIVREPESDDSINADGLIVDDTTARHTPLRAANQGAGIVHAVVSCKWTLRSDRAQNARSEALNIIRNRKGRTPHIVVVTGEPSPSRISSLALGTGDLDTVYHFALPELVNATDASDNSEAISTLHNLIDGKRLRDISDLPLDLAV